MRPIVRKTNTAGSRRPTWRRAGTRTAAESGPAGADAARSGDDIDLREDDGPAAKPGRPVRLALAVGVAAAVAMTALVGWLGYRSYESHQALDKRNLFVEVARQGAVYLTTISFTEADADVARILDSATGTFHDDFQNRSQPFIDVVKQAQTKTEGTVGEAGLESEDGDTARVLVAVTVKTSNAGVPQQAPRSWRLRIDVQKHGDGAKVSNVGFVP